MNTREEEEQNVPSLRTGGRYCRVDTTAQTSPELPMVLTALSLGEKCLRVHAHTHTIQNKTKPEEKS